MTHRCPHRCPVCSGTGFVGVGFYILHGSAGTSARNEECRSCGASGVIWGQTTGRPLLLMTRRYVTADEILEVDSILSIPGRCNLYIRALCAHPFGVVADLADVGALLDEW